MIVKESAVSQKNNLMNKILLFLLGGCIIGSAITIFSAQNKQKKIPTQQNAESKQNTQQEDRISTISPNILLGFHLGMSKLEYNSLIKQYKNSGKMSIWDNNTYCMHWFETQNITVHDNSVGNFTSTQSFSIIFDIQPKFVNNKLHTLSMLIEPLYDDTILVQTSNIILLKNHISKILGSQPPLNSFHWTFSTYTVNLSQEKIKSSAKEKLCLCEEMDCNPVNCPYAKGHFDRVNDAVFDLLQKSNLFTREEVLAQAKEYQVCPFEMSSGMVATGRTNIVCDYNYVFDPNDI